MTAKQDIELLRVQARLQSFMAEWKRLKRLVDSCFQAGRVTLRVETAFTKRKERLQRLWPVVSPHLEKARLTWQIPGRALSFDDPISQILSTMPHISYLLQDNWLYGGLTKEHFDTMWGAGTSQLNGALGRVQAELESVEDFHLGEYLLLKPWVDRLARARRAWQQYVVRPVGNVTAIIRRPLDPMIQAIERNPGYKALAIISTLGGAGFVIFLLVRALI